MQGDWACREGVCIAATVETDLVTYEVSSSLDFLGWVGIGFGNQMLHTPLVVLWKNSDGATVISQRYATRYVEPEVDTAPHRVAELVEPKHLLDTPPSKATFSFKVSSNNTLLSVQPLVFAFSSVPPRGNGPRAHLSFHQHASYMHLNLTKEFDVSSHVVVPPPSMHDVEGQNYSTTERLILLHAFFVSFGFLVLLPAGSLFARYARAFIPDWFKYHWKTNFMIAGPVITMGVLLGPIIVLSKTSFRIHFANAHEICGALLLLLYYAQVMLGRYIHDRRSKLARLGPITHPHPPLNILHIILGVSIITLSFFQIRSGMGWWETLTHRGPITNWASPLWKAWMVILFIAYFSGYFLLPRQLRMEAATVAYRPVSEENGQSIPFLAPDGQEGSI